MKFTTKNTILFLIFSILLIFTISAQVLPIKEPKKPESAKKVDEPEQVEPKAQTT